MSQRAVVKGYVFFYFFPSGKHWHFIYITLINPVALSASVRKNKYIIPEHIYCYNKNNKIENISEKN